MTSVWPILMGLILLLLALSIRELFKDRESRVRVAAWGDLQENALLIDRINDFRKEYPRIQVELERFTFADYMLKVLEEMRLGNGHDVVFLEGNYFGDFYFNNCLQPLTPFIKAEAQDLAVFYPQIISRFTLEKDIYSLPRDIAPICLVYYNKKAFDEARVPYPRSDWDWDGFVDCALKLKKTAPSGETIRWGYVEDWAMADAWVYDAGGAYADDSQNPSRWTFAEDPRALQGIQFRRDLIHKHKVMPPPWVLDGAFDQGGGEMFAQGKAAMCLCGLWKTPRFREIRDFTWDVALMPKGLGGQWGFGMGGTGYGMLKGTKSPKAAWKFIHYMSNAEGARKLSAGGLIQPAYQRIADSPVFLDGKDPQNKRVLLSAVTHGHYAPLCRNWLQTKKLIDEELNEVWRGTRTPEDAMKRLKPLLEKYPPLI